jgi:hypothetical protein
MRRELAAQRGRTLPEDSKPDRILKSVPSVDEDLIPDVLGDRSEEDIEIDGIIASIDVLDAYRKWIGKEVDEKTTGGTESIKVSCPNPGHRDKDPSAWLNSEKRTWFCGGCQEGGDIYDLAAIKFNFPRPDYKEGKTFHELRQQMAESYGYRFKKVAGKEVIWREEPDEPGTDGSDEAAGPGDEPSPEPPAEPPAKVRVLREEDVEEEVDNIGYPTIDWRTIVPEDTFLRAYLDACTNDDSPEEYHFWHGLLGLAHAVGRNVSLNDTRPVYSNLLVCLLGGTGYGKSRSRAWLDDVIEAALPFSDNGLDTTGCKLVPVPASGENLINQFQHIATDPSLPKGLPTVRTPVNGLVDYDEFAGLLARAGRQGSTLKQILMQFSDSRSRISSSSNTGGTYEAYQPFCSITASTQPKAIRPLLARTDAASGFLNRWLFVGGPKKQREVMGGIHSSITVDLSDAIDKLKKVRGWGATQRDVRFTEDGLEEYEKFIRNRVFPMQAKDETDLLTRLDLTMKRLVLLFCINEKKTEVDADIVKRVEPILEYLFDCYSILSAEIGITQMSEITSDILRLIKKIQEDTGRGASARDLGVRMHRKNYSPDLIKRALETMVALDWIDVDKTKSGPGRPTIRYKVVS